MTTLKICPVCGERTKKSKERRPTKACGNCRRTIPKEELPQYGEHVLGRKRKAI